MSLLCKCMNRYCPNPHYSDSPKVPPNIDCIKMVEIQEGRPDREREEKYTVIDSLRYESFAKDKGRIYINGDEVFPFYTKDGVVSVESDGLCNYVTIRLVVFGPVEVVPVPTLKTDEED